jgi:hypothetical protein
LTRQADRAPSSAFRSGGSIEATGTRSESRTGDFYRSNPFDSTRALTLSCRRCLALVALRLALTIPFVYAVLAIRQFVRDNK